MEINSVEKIIETLFQDQIYHFNDKVSYYAGISEDTVPFFLLISFLTQKKDVIFISENDTNAGKLYEKINQLFTHLGSSFIKSRFNINKKYYGIFYFPGWGIMPYHNMKPDYHYEAYRSMTLASFQLPELKHRLIITSVSGMVRRLPDNISDEHRNLILRKGEDASREKLIQYFDNNGYERVDIVETRGDFAVKGGIIDFFCPVYEHPVRIEFFGNEIDSIKFFNIHNQLSIDKKDEIWVVPRRDIEINNKLLENLQNKAKKNLNLKIPNFLHQEDSNYAGLWDLYPLGVKTIKFSDLWNNNHLLFIRDIENIKNIYIRNIEEASLFHEKAKDRFVAPVDELFINQNDFYETIENGVYLDLLGKKLNYHKTPIKKQKLYKGKISEFLENLHELSKSKKTIFFTSENQIQIGRISNLIENYHSETIVDINIIESSFKEGFSTPSCELFTEKDIFGKNIFSGKVKKTNTEIIESYIDIKEGDYIVHVNYGIGRFLSIKRMKAAGYERDFLVLEYAEEDRLYVPLEQLKYVHRYIGSQENVRLDYLGKKSSWEKTKQKVHENIEKLAEELIAVYAERENARGFSFKADTIYQEKFEADFPYQETDHQIMAIEEVKKDMESMRPMDRLICGDVGFGKTEVAIRAAFKAVMSGKQVAFLCPTTVLTLQHFNTFQSRLNHYSIETDYLSRFKTQSEIKKTKEKLKKGEIDIIIGTHALLSEGIEYRDLGLLIIDEEQKFGVKHKEKIKSVKKNIDCLTMTATPIPRTLHMSMSGLRDLSLIETPPGNRRKIETYITEESDDLLIEAIRKEIKRNGQIYIMHNKVKTIDAVASRIHSLYPKASLKVLHGQMHEDEIEEILVEFYEHYFDILVTTTIIESGIDIPNVNTLIVLNSDRFGLSQLYQLKGRVGRSDRKAFAYFFYQPGKVIHETAQKRLNTLQEYDDLGSGFKIALKDLEIRGAGNLLGKEQSGDIMNVGFELYLEMLNKKMDELKNIPSNTFESNIVIPNDYYIPDSYIEDTRQKMEVYKKISAAKFDQELEKIESEVQDRFGQFPELMQNIFYLEYIRVIANRTKLDKIEKKGEIFHITVSGETDIKLETFQSILSNDQRLKLNPLDPRIFSITPADQNKPLKEVYSILSYIL